MKNRGESARGIEGASFDVCVIGAGATGSACALDAQLRGLRTLLVDAADFASGTSSASTKIVHGGVRYLEQAVRHFDLAQYRVLKSALRERVIMLKNAPYLTRTLEFLVPCADWSHAAYFAVGLKIYDWLAGSVRLSPSHLLGAPETLRRMPALNSTNLVASVAYADGQFDDSRYNIALVATFAQAGGEALNYAKVVGFEKSVAGRLGAAQLEDQFTHRRFEIAARAFVNAAGPFSDAVCDRATPGLPPRIRLSKGVHILLRIEIMPGRDALVIPKTDDGRVLFAIPWMGRLLVGATDQEVSAAGQLYVTREDVEYLLRHLNRYLARPVGPEQIVSGIAGVRPLIGASHARETKSLARDHEVVQDPGSGLITIRGGKWTTHRAMAEDTIDAVQKYLEAPPVPCRTRDFPLLGSQGFTPDYWRSLAENRNIVESTARHLAGKFGTLAPEILNLARRDPDLAQSLVEGYPAIRAEVVHCVRNEMAVTLEDILFRRLGIQIYSWKSAIDSAPIVASIMASELGWSSEFVQSSVRAYTQKIESYFRLAGIASPDAFPSAGTPV